MTDQIRVFDQYRRAVEYLVKQNFIYLTMTAETKPFTYLYKGPHGEEASMSNVNEKWRVCIWVESKKKC
jgi:hypothetical protein